MLSDTSLVGMLVTMCSKEQRLSRKVGVPEGGAKDTIGQKEDGVEDEQHKV